jgi:molybdopterin-guanine dinucleotide biosynthesis protein MobB
VKTNCICIVGWSGSGKTTLIEQMVRELRRRKIPVAAVKHTSDVHPLHPPESDSGRLANAGAGWVGFATGQGVQITFPETIDRVLGRLLPVLAGASTVLLIEGWKNSVYPKLEILRADLGRALYPQDASIKALVADRPPPNCSLPVFHRDNVPGIVDWIIDRLGIDIG